MTLIYSAQPHMHTSPDRDLTGKRFIMPRVKIRLEQLDRVQPHGTQVHFIRVQRCTKVLLYEGTKVLSYLRRYSIIVLPEVLSYESTFESTSVEGSDVRKYFRNLGEVFLLPFRFFSGTRALGGSFSTYQMRLAKTAPQDLTNGLRR
jgi:hypothetical protein